jgi:dCTP diphosphatase
MSDFSDLVSRLRAFAEERDWEQFHSPKNLTMALLGEAGELIEHFQWLTEEVSRNLPSDKKAAVSQELADVLLYLVRLSDTLDIDLYQAALQKIEINAKNYPSASVKGSAKKYTEY